MPYTLTQAVNLRGHPRIERQLLKMRVERACGDLAVATQTTDNLNSLLLGKGGTSGSIERQQDDLDPFVHDHADETCLTDALRVSRAIPEIRVRSAFQRVSPRAQGSSSSDEKLHSVGGLGQAPETPIAVSKESGSVIGRARRGRIGWPGEDSG